MIDRRYPNLVVTAQAPLPWDQKDELLALGAQIAMRTDFRCCYDTRHRALYIFYRDAFAGVHREPAFRPDGTWAFPGRRTDEIVRLLQTSRASSSAKAEWIARKEKQERDELEQKAAADLDDKDHESLDKLRRSLRKRVTAGTTT